jgi:O-antigen biosynthesis protein
MVRRGSEAEGAVTAFTRSVLALVDSVESVVGRVLEPDDVTPVYGGDASSDEDGYVAWIAEHQPDLDGLRRRIAALVDPPRFAVTIPVYKPSLVFFWRCVRSVIDQVYPHWELCLCDDGSEDPQLDALFARLPSIDPRIRVTKLPKNGGISAATNAALDLSDAEHVAFMDHDDELTPDALAEVALALAADPTIDVLYTDEDKIDEADRRFAPFFKPDWSPDYLLSCAYTGHLSVVRRSLVEEVGRLRSAFDGSQDHDLMLRTTERARTIAHLPKILYHWRAIEGSAASSSEAKPWAHEAGYRVVQDAMDRRGEPAEILPGAFAGARRVKRQIVGNPRVDVIIPFRDGGSLLHRCIEALELHAGYDNWHGYLVDNGSWEPETLALVDILAKDERYTVLHDPSPFNWSRINNDAAAQGDGELLLFLNNDIEATHDGWLSALVEHGQRPEVGAVGGKLRYPDGSIQHAGLIIGMGGIAGHAFRYCPTWHSGYFGMARVIRDFTAVTGACMLVRRSVFDELDGFDDELAVSYNDVDFCLRLRERGYLVVYTPYAELVHHESVTRGMGEAGVEEHRMLGRWRELYERGDPYFNPNLSLAHSEFRFARQDEPPPWRRFEPVDP